MGLFLAISGVVDAEHEAVISALSSYAAENGGLLEPMTAATNEKEVLSVCSTNGNVTVQFPEWDLSWEKASQSLSQKLERPVFAFYIHDDDFWMYILFRNGVQVDRFNPIPDYFGKVSEQDRQADKGNADLVCQCVPGLRREQIEKYLVTWNRGSAWDIKAYPDDEFPIGDFWQMVDFMKRLNFPYDPTEATVISSFRYKIPRRSL
jgi:hypothetical protein